MPDRLLAPAAVATLLSLTTTAVTAQTPGTMNAEQGWSSIARCAQEDTERARHTCLDGVLRDAGLLTPEMHARQQRNAFGFDDNAARAVPPAATATSPAAAVAAPATAVTAPATAAKSPAASAEALNRRAAGTTNGATSGGTTTPTSAPPPPAATASPGTAVTAASAAPQAQPDRIEVELSKVEKAADGNLFVTTTDGAVWLQAEAVDMPQRPVKGDRMTIRKGSMGGYRCSVVSTHLTYRCVRSR